MSSDDYLFVLVNGTWAGKTGLPPFPIFKPAEYMTEKHHILRLILTKKIQKENSNSKVIFINGWWHSRNNVQCRKDGAVKIAKEIRNYLSKYKGQLPNIFLIAHSHGSDVCYRIMQEEDLSKHINGLIAMNSPNMIELKRDFVINIKARKKWLIRSMLLICATYTLILIWSMIISHKNIGSIGENIEQHLQHICIILMLILFTYILAKNMKKLIYYTSNKSSDFKFDHMKHKVLCTNSSGDEAWNVLNFLSSIAQLPFFMTHPKVQPILGGVLVLLLTIATFNNPQFTSNLLEYIPVFGDLLNSVNADEPNRMIVASVLLIAVITLFFLAIFSFINFLLGYGLSYIFEIIGIGNSWKLKNQNFSTRIIVSMIPAHIENLQFIDTSENINKLNLTEANQIAHSRPYLDEWAIERMADWVITGKADISAPRKS